MAVNETRKKVDMELQNVDLSSRFVSFDVAGTVSISGCTAERSGVKMTIYIAI